MKNILVVGSINMDLVINTAVVPGMGETIHGTSFSTIPGGKGANQAIACGKLGGNVKMIACVGNDIYGETCMENLRNNNVDISCIEKAEDNTGIAVITVCNGDNSIILVQGANKRLSAQMIEKNIDAFIWADIVIMQLEIPLETVLFAAKLAKEYGAKVVLNPAPMVKLDFDLLKYVDFLIPNQYEAGDLLYMEIDSVPTAKQAVRKLLDMGIENSIITLGECGCVYNDGEEIIHKQAHKVTAVDTTAAGDSFIGGLCTSLSMGKGLCEAIDDATTVSAITVTRKGASISIPTMAEVKSYTV